jgi:arginase family enzyme
MKTKITNIKKLAYLGAAISEGQAVRGVETGPNLLRGAGMFHMLNKNYGVDVVDYGDIKLE